MKRDDDDVLAADVRALRAATMAPADGEATRARVLGLIERDRTRRALLRRVGVGALAVVVTLALGSAAWTAIGRVRARPPVAARPTVLAGPSSPQQAAPRSTPPTTEPPAVPAAVTPPARVRPAATAGAETALYARAHEAHFTDDDPARALAAWNRYLAGYPRGAFVPDARYNRALCLLRLGQHEAAARALRPFANGSYQGYRRLEAESLLDWMARQAPR